MTPGTGLHGVSLAYVPGIGMAPRVTLPPRPAKRRLSANAYQCIHVLRYLTAAWQSAASLRAQTGMMGSTTLARVTATLREHGLVENRMTKPKGGGTSADYRLTQAGLAEQAAWRDGPEPVAAPEPAKPAPARYRRVLLADAVAQRRVLLAMPTTSVSTEQVRDMLGLTQPRAADALRRLARNGLVAQDWHNRARVWTLTPAGQAEQAAWGML